MPSDRDLITRFLAASALVTLLSCGGDGGPTGPTNPTPTLDSGSADSVVATGGAFIDTLFGDDFMEEAVATIDGKARETVRHDSWMLTFEVTAADISKPGIRQIRVKNPGPGGGPSEPLPLHIIAPPAAPTIDSLASDTVLSDRAATIEVYGSNFTRESKIRWNDSILITSRESATHLSAYLPAALVTAPGTRSISVLTPAPGGGTSASKPFTVVLAPAILSTTPDTIRTGPGAIPFTIRGRGFALVDTIQSVYEATFQTLVPVSRTDSTLEFMLDRSAMAVYGNLNVRLITRFGNTPFALVNVKNPIPTVSSVTPDTVDGTGPVDTVVVTGTGFRAGMYGLVSGAYVPTEIVNDTQLVAVLDIERLMTGGPGTFGVHDQSGPVTSNLVPFVIRNPAPVVDSLAGPPADSIGGSARYVLWGSNFRKNGKLLVNGVPVTPDHLYIQSYAIDFNLSPAQTGAAGTLMISWSNDAPGGGSSAAFPLQIIVPYPSPQITGIDHEYLSPDSGDVTVVLTGQGFLPGSTVALSLYPDFPAGGLSLVSTRLSDTAMQVVVPAGALGEPRPVYFHAMAPFPSALPSSNITALGLSHGIQSLRTLPFGAIDLVGDPVRDRLYVLKSFSFGQQAWLLAIDPTTGAGLDSMMLTVGPAQAMDIASDGSELYLAGPGLGVLAVDPLTLDTLYSVPEGKTADSIPWQSVALAAARGHPGRIAVLRAPTAPSASGWQVRIIEGGVPLPGLLEVPIGSGPLTLDFAPGDSVLVVLRSGSRYRRLSVGPTGLSAGLDVPMLVATGDDAVVSGSVVLTEYEGAVDFMTGAIIPPPGFNFQTHAVSRGRSGSRAYIARLWSFNGSPVTQVDRIGGSGGMPLGTIAIPRGVGPTATAITTWGANGFAVGGAGQVIIGTSAQTSE
jgi:hypothetical protein